MRIVTGHPVSLREAVGKRVHDLRREDPLDPITVLVGTSLQRPFLGRWLAARLGSHANVRILMPGDLGLALGAPGLVTAGRRALPPLADRVLLSEVVREQSGYFSPVAETPGFAEALYRLVRELRAGGYDLANLGPVLEGTTDAGEKAGSLADVLARFSHRRASFYGPDDALVAADPALLRGLGLLVWGVLDLPPVLERLIGEVAAHVPVDVYLPDTRASSDAPFAEVIDRFVLAGAEHEQLRPPDMPPTALNRVRQALFAAPMDGVPSDESLRLISAPDPSREVRAAARACLAWAADGVPFWDMAVAYRHGEAYRPLVEAVFIEAGIPVYLHEGSPLAERPVGRQTLALLALYETDFPRQSVMDFLTDVRAPAPLREEFDGLPVFRWDSISRRAGIVAGLAQWQQRLAGFRRDLERGVDDDDPPAWIAERISDTEALARFLVDLDARLGGHPERATWAAHLDSLNELLSRYVAGAEEIVEALRGLERFTALQHDVDFDTFLEVVRRAIETLRSEDVLEGRPGAFARRGVNVVAVNSLPGVEFARVWMLGATERAFPPPPRQDPILLDAERALISERTGVLLAPRGARGSEEELHFELACHAARERLVLSYARRATGESRPRLPSIFFREIASQLVGERVSADRAPLLNRPDIERIPGDTIGAPIAGGRYAETAKIVSDAAAGAASPVERDRTYLQAAVTQPVAIATLEAAQPAFARARQADQARWSSAYSEWDGALGPAGVSAIAELITPGFALSATALEAYATCPQRFLLGHVLRIRAVEEPERTVRIDALRRGTLIHRILERFHAEWDATEPASLAGVAGERMRQIAEEECAAAEARGETGYPAMWYADQREVVDDCLRWLDVERSDPATAQLTHGAFEARFGPARPGEPRGALSQDEPIILDLGQRQLFLTGRIDRLMWNTERSRYRVLDYKTGRVRDEKSAQLQGGRMLQLPLYVLAAGKLLGIEPQHGEAAYVYPTRRGGFKTIEWTGHDLAQRHDDVLVLLDAVLRCIAEGDFMVAPWSDTACRYCPFDPICPVSRAAYVKRKAGDERLTPLLESIRNLP